MAVVRTAAEGDVVVLHPAGPEDGRLHVGIEAMVVELITVGLVPGAETVGAQHRQVIAHGLHAAGGVITDAELAAAAPSGGNLDDARSAAGPVLRRLRRILEDGETVDVPRIHRPQRGKVAYHAVDDDQRVVTTRQGGGTAHAHRAEHRRLVGAGHRDTGRLAGQGAQAAGHQTLVHLFPGDGVLTRGGDGCRVRLAPQGERPEECDQQKKPFHN